MSRSRDQRVALLKPNQEETVRVEWTVGTVAGNVVGELGVYVLQKGKAVLIFLAIPSLQKYLTQPS